MTAGRAQMTPTPEQIAAADPQASAWVSANAGSGKTRVLTQRVARLLLAGAEPQKILCLTYTRAAAAEMQNRLFETLGQWAMAPDGWLGAEIAALEGQAAPISAPDRLAEARRLFARALETPGGLKIQTIHAFCDALLRRFPLEAGVSPRFEVMDERQSDLALAEIRARMAEDAAAGRDDAFDRVATRMNEGGIDDLVTAILRERERFPETDLEARLEAHFGDAATRAPEELAETALEELRAQGLQGFAEVLLSGGQTEAGIGRALVDVLADALAGPAEPLLAARALIGAVLTKEGQRRKKGFPTKDTLARLPESPDLVACLSSWAETTRERLLACESAARARDLNRFAMALLARYRAWKAARGLLDFDDLVRLARRLLGAADMAQWTLWKLDQGIDHILVDEAQDTSPVQWEVINAIAREFHAGQGAHEGARTLFVVGDEKQSIYSFQGAEPQAFGATRAALMRWLEEMGRRLERPELVTSFRSAPGILRFVDAVFAGDAAHGLTLEEGEVRHLAHRAEDPSRIDLWPLIEPQPAPPAGDWHEMPPVDAPPPGHQKIRLARLLATEIQRMLAEDRLPARQDRPARPIRPGDILVLVARRDLLAESLIRELKSRGVPVAGADRLSLAAELAVKDLMALVKVAITPGDDLSLAAVLRSPLCGLDEEALFELAHGRGDKRLWDRLMEAGECHAEAVGMLRDMAAQADYLRPYEFLERALVRHDGRRRLLARLGGEAEDPIDELLTQALSFETRAVPSLAGFVTWIEARDIKVKREMEHGRDEVRVMTVHGAKGLEAPVVILPDTVGTGNRRGATLLPVGGENGLPSLVLWPGAKAEDDPVTASARAAADARAEAERRRLLYVALTRAEDRLLICGARGKDSPPAGSWYMDTERAMEALGGAEVQGPDGLPGPVRRFDDSAAGGMEAESAEVSTPAPAVPPRPAWLSPAPPETRRRVPAPSALGAAAESASGGATRDRERARQHGLAVHFLLERLAERGSEALANFGPSLLKASYPNLDAAGLEAAVAEVRTVLEAPFAAEVFGPDSFAEARLRIALPGLPEPMQARVDRVVIGSGRVMVVDYKTDSRPPTRPGDVPSAYLVQIGAYRTALASIYPDRAVSAALLWTAGPSIMPLPDTLLDAALAEVVAAGSEEDAAS